MLCIISFAGAAPHEGRATAASIDGWLIAADVDDARRQAHGNGLLDLAAALYQINDLPAGRHVVGNHLVLVS